MKKETVMKQVEAYVDSNERHLARTRKAASKYWGMAKAEKDRGDRLAEENAHLEKRVAYWEHECSRLFSYRSLYEKAHEAELSYKAQLEARAHLPQADAALLKRVEDLKEKVKFLLRQREEHLAQLRGKNLDYKRMYENLKENTVLILREIDHDIRTRPLTQMSVIIDKIQTRVANLQGRF